MIIETLIISATTIIVSGLVVADRINKRFCTDIDTEAIKASFDERRRILERRREVWVSHWNGNKASGNWAGISQVDRALIDLAKEEAKAFGGK